MMWIWDQQKDKKSLATDSDTESENETHGAGEDFTGVSGVTIECNNPHSVSEIAINFGLVKIKVTSHRH